LDVDCARATCGSPPSLIRSDRSAEWRGVSWHMLCIGISTCLGVLGARFGIRTKEAVVNEAIWCVVYGLLWWWVALMMPDCSR
jgi:hypothetical protein